MGMTFSLTNNNSLLINLTFALNLIEYISVLREQKWILFYVAISRHAGVVQSVERLLAKEKVESSSLFARSGKCIRLVSYGRSGRRYQFLFSGDVAKLVRQGSAKPPSRVRVPSSPSSKKAPHCVGCFFMSAPS